MFNAASGFQINGGIFYGISGDMNIHGARPTIGQGSNPLTVLESGLNASTRRLVGVQRNERRGEAARVMPYERARSPPLLHRLYESPGQLPVPATIPSLPSAPPQADVSTSSPFPPRDHRAHISISGNVNQIQHHGEQGFHMLHRAAAADAFHDSAERFPQPRCHPETRTEMLENLWKWSSNTDSSSSVFWLHGPAGAGKSAIAQSFCQKLEEHHRLGASFFFKRGNPSRGTGKKLFPTLAYQLALPLAAFKETVSVVLEYEPSIIDRELSTQLQKLVIEPSRKTIRRTLVIVIDGLDECEGKEIQCEILRSIGNAIREMPLSLRFFIASRPESHIREIFTNTLQGIYFGVNINQSFDDVRRYFLGEFARIHREHQDTMAKVLRPWPALKVVEELVQKSSGYFVYASTVIKFIDDEEFRPTERLEVILGTKEAEDESPYAALDQLYIQILSQSRARPRLLRVLTVVAAKLELSPRHIEQLLGLELGDVRLTLRGLQSVVGLEEPCLDHKSPPVVHHASFYDFLQNFRRAGCFYIGGCLHKMDLSRCILNAFSHHHTATLKVNNDDCLPWVLTLRLRQALQCVVYSDPAWDLISLLRSFNLFWLFCNQPQREPVTEVLGWLKKSQPLPADLIRVWEEYSFMCYFECTWVELATGVLSGAAISGLVVLQEEWDHSQQILSQATPSLIRIMQSTTSIYNRQLPGPLLRIHLLLGVSWTELRVAICSLRPFLADNERRCLRVLFIVAHQSMMISAHSDRTVSDLICGALRVMQQIRRGELPAGVWTTKGLEQWSRYLRQCPPSPKLLEDITPLLRRHFEMKAVDCQNIVQWLKTFPEPPLDAISHFEQLEIDCLENEYSDSSSDDSESESDCRSSGSDTIEGSLPA